MQKLPEVRNVSFVTSLRFALIRWLARRDSVMMNTGLYTAGDWEIRKIHPNVCALIADDVFWNAEVRGFPEPLSCEIVIGYHREHH